MLKIKGATVYGAALIISCLLMYGLFFQPKEWLNINDQDKFSGKSWEKQLTISIFDYLPIYAKFPPTNPAPKYPETLEGLADFKSNERGSDYKKWVVDVTDEAILRTPVFDFPGMKVFIDGLEASHSSNDCRNQEFCLGLVTFPIDPGRHEILVKLTNTPVRSIGNVLTLISLFLVIVLLAPRHKYFKKWLS